ncbi:MAG: tyrosine-protein phosphatase [Gaiellaceae bacterium]
MSGTIERDLAWEGCLNVRDLGGHATGDGETTRFGAVVRADSIRKLTDAGWGDLVGHGVTTIVDLRMDEELEADPPAELPVEVVHVNLFGGAEPDYGQHLDALAGAAASPSEATKAVYLDFLERFAPNVAAAFRAIADASEGAVLVHCQGGKDRTGLVVALLLSLAGVEREEVSADYAISERKLAERQATWEAEADTAEDRERRRQMGLCPPEAMLGVLEELERRYGGVRQYLLAAGSTEDELDRAVGRLR